MAGHLSKRSSIIIIGVGVLSLIIVVLGVKTFFNKDASPAGDQLANMELRLKKLETKLAALEFHDDGLPLVMERSRQIETDLLEICEREAELLSRLSVVEKKLKIPSQSAQVAKPRPETPELTSTAKTGEKPPETVSKTPEKKVKTDEAPKPAVSQKVFYEVKKGDTVYSISRTHGITPEQLRQLNNLDSNTIVPGQKLNVTP